MRNLCKPSHRLRRCSLNTKELSIKTPLKNALRKGYYNISNKFKVERGPLLFHQVHCKLLAFPKVDCGIVTSTVAFEYVQCIFRGSFRQSKLKGVNVLKPAGFTSLPIEQVRNNFQFSLFCELNFHL